MTYLHAPKTGETIDCAQGAAVALVKDDAIVAKVIANNYGDFKFDKIEQYRTKQVYTCL